MDFFHIIATLQHLWWKGTRRQWVNEESLGSQQWQKIRMLIMMLKIIMMKIA